MAKTVVSASNVRRIYAHSTPRAIFVEGERSVVGRSLPAYIGRVAATALTGRGEELDPQLFFSLLDQRDKLAQRAVAAFVFLFSTLLLLTLVQFDQAIKFPLLGMEIGNKKIFVFLALVLGNLVYVVSAGLYMKTLAYEYFLLKVCEADAFRLGRNASEFLACHQLNTLLLCKLNGLDSLFPRGYRALLNSALFYVRWGMAICYGLFFYSVLAIFLRDLSRSWTVLDVVLGSVLIVLNLMTSILTAMILLPAPQPRLNN
jgi:hypothetical protein